MDKMNTARKTDSSLQTLLVTEAESRSPHATFETHSIAIDGKQGVQSIQKQASEEPVVHSLAPADKEQQLTERKISKSQKKSSTEVGLTRQPARFVIEFVLDKLCESFAYFADTPPPGASSKEEKMAFCKKHRSKLVRTFVMIEEQARRMYRETRKALDRNTLYSPEPVTVEIGYIQYYHNDSCVEMQDTKIVLKEIVLSKHDPDDIALVLDAGATLDLKFHLNNDEDLQDYEKESARIREEYPDEFKDIPHINLAGGSAPAEPPMYRLVARVGTEDFKLVLNPDSSWTPSVHGFLDSGYIKAIRKLLAQPDSSFFNAFSDIKINDLQEDMKIFIKTLSLQLLDPDVDPALPRADLTLTGTAFESETRFREELPDAEKPAPDTDLLTRNIVVDRLSFSIPDKADEVMNISPVLPVVVSLILGDVERIGITTLEYAMTNGFFAGMITLKKVLMPFIEQARKKLPNTVDAMQHNMVERASSLAAWTDVYQKCIGPIQRGEPDKLSMVINDIRTRITAPVASNPSAAERWLLDVMIEDAMPSSRSETGTARDNPFIRHSGLFAIKGATSKAFSKLKSLFSPKQTSSPPRAEQGADCQASAGDNLVMTLGELTLLTQNPECQVMSTLNNITLSREKSSAVQVAIKGTQSAHGSSAEPEKSGTTTTPLTGRAPSASASDGDVRAGGICRPAVSVKIDSNRKTRAWPFSGVMDIVSEGQIHMEMVLARRNAKPDRSTRASRGLSTSTTASATIAAAKASTRLKHEHKAHFSFKLQDPLELTATVTGKCAEHVGPESTRLPETGEKTIKRHLTTPKPSSKPLEAVVTEPSMTNPRQASSGEPVVVPRTIPNSSQVLSGASAEESGLTKSLRPLPENPARDLQASTTVQPLEKGAGITGDYSERISECTARPRKECRTTLKIWDIDEIISPDEVAEGGALITRILAQLQEGEEDVVSVRMSKTS